MDRCPRTRADIEKTEILSVGQCLNILYLDNDTFWMITVITSGPLAVTGWNTLPPSLSNVFLHLLSVGVISDDLPLLILCLQCSSE